MIRRIVLVVALLAIAAGPAFAVPLNPLNVRPVTPSEGFNHLQYVLGEIYGPGFAPNPATDQLAPGMWSFLGDSPAGMVLTLQYQAGSFENDVAFGIWSGTTTAAINTVEIYSGAAAPFTLAELFWDSPNSLKITGGAGVNVGTNFNIDRYNYGFYITTPVTDPSHKHFSLDQLNHNGDAQMVTYIGADGTQAFLFEDQDGVNRNNYSDLAVTVAPPVPEPASLLLLGTGMVGLATAVRRRVKK